MPMDGLLDKPILLMVNPTLRLENRIFVLS